MSEKKNVPKLRFPEFTEPWEQRKFGELAEYKKGPFGSAITKSMFVPKSDDSVKVYEQQNAINKDWSLERYFLPKEYAYTKLKAFEVHGGDIIVSCAGTIGEIYEIPDNAEYGVINQALMRVRVDEKTVDKRMFIIAFSNMINEFTRTHSNGSAIKNIPPFADLKPMKVLMPSMEEQRVISEYFEKMDNLITLHQRKLKHVKMMKKSMLQKMFPKKNQLYPEVRFPEFTDAWEQRKLGDVVEFLDTMRKPLEGAKRISGPYPYYGASGIVDYVDGYLFDEELVLLSEDGANITDRNYPVCYLASGKYWVNNHAHVLKTKDGNENNFICNSLERKDYKQYNSGMAMPKLNQEVCRGIPISCPSFDEQKKIGDYFRNLDHLITLHQRELDHLQLLKKGMLQQMFI